MESRLGEVGGGGRGAFGLTWETFISVEQLVFTRVKRASCWSADKRRRLCPAHPAHIHPTTSKSSLPSSLWRLLKKRINKPSPALSLSHLSLLPFTFFLTAQFPLFFPRFVSPHLLHFLSADALMSAHACCHRPPVRYSARHDWIELCRTRPNSTRFRRQTEPTGDAWNGTVGVNVVW